VATAPESHYVLDGLLGNETDLPVFEHATDTHGATLANRRTPADLTWPNSSGRGSRRSYGRRRELRSATAV